MFVVAHKSDAVLRLIGALKLLKALALIGCGIGLLKIGSYHHDPENRYINHLIAKIGHASPRRIKELGIGCFAYAALFATEGIGLSLRKVWAEYLTTFITTSFIPLEIYELVQHRSWVKAAVIVANIAIVIYLVLRLRRDKQWPFR
jgi:uncharacterized membrane protein (DUF2068 family)